MFKHIEPQIKDFMTTLQKGGSRDNLSDTYLPSVRFQLPSPLKSYEYIRWFTELFQAFILTLSDKKENRWAAQQFYVSALDEEGGTGGLYIGDQYFEYCKLFLYDTETNPHIGGWKGVRLCNHFDQRGRVAPIYLLAEKFEEYLAQNNIPFQRFGRKIDDPEECEQTTV